MQKTITTFLNSDNSLDKKNDEASKPSKRVIDNILNYSKSLEIVKVGKISAQHILN